MNYEEFKEQMVEDVRKGLEARNGHGYDTQTVSFMEKQFK